MLNEKPNYLKVNDTVRTQAIGHCIYCGATDELSDEHVVPLGLAGKVVLPAASCPVCAQITSKFERSVLRGFMYDARVVGDFPTRRPHKRPNAMQVTLRGPEGVRHPMVSPKDHPGLLLLPILSPAGILSGIAQRGVTVSGYEALYFGKDPSRAIKDFDASALELSVEWEVTAFARLIAKIAYCFAIVSQGPFPREHCPILPFILGHSDDGGTWLGSATSEIEAEDDKAMHKLSWREAIDPSDPEQMVWVIQVKLFAGSGASAYHVVVYRPSSKPLARASDFDQSEGSAPKHHVINITHNLNG